MRLLQIFRVYDKIGHGVAVMGDNVNIMLTSL